METKKALKGFFYEIVYFILDLSSYPIRVRFPRRI